MMEIFKEVDENKNGLISREEFSRAAESNETNRKFADIMKQSWDKEIANGKVDWGVFIPLTLD